VLGKTMEKGVTRGDGRKHELVGSTVCFLEPDGFRSEENIPFCEITLLQPNILKVEHIRSVLPYS
jgi:hypothetical protein